jgi:hypothetical protein
LYVHLDYLLFMLLSSLIVFPTLLQATAESQQSGGSAAKSKSANNNNNKKTSSEAAATGKDANGAGGAESGEVAVDFSLWDSTNTDASKSASIPTTPCAEGLAVTLVSLLAQQEDENTGLLKSWVSCNRPCLALADICHVPSAKTAALSLLEAYRGDLERAASSSEGHTAGAKILLETISSAGKK